MTHNGDFWSRRKAGVAQEAEREEHLRAEAEAARNVAALEERPDEDILAELALPDPETMQPDDDFAAFMHHAVPERLRKQALRQLWRSDPVLANIDGLNNYDTDFTQSDIPGVAVKTSYEIGKGFARAVLKPDADAAPAPANTADPAQIEAPAAEAEAEAPPPEDAQQCARAANADDVETDDFPITRGRMRFAYVDQDPTLETP